MTSAAALATGVAAPGLAAGTGVASIRLAIGVAAAGLPARTGVAATGLAAMTGVAAVGLAAGMAGRAEGTAVAVACAGGVLACSVLGIAVGTGWALCPTEQPVTSKANVTASKLDCTIGFNALFFQQNLALVRSRAFIV